MSSTIKLALIGCGGLGKLHLENLQRLHDVSVEALCDINEEAARECCEKVGGRYYTTDTNKIFQDRSIDAVVICTRHDSHTKLAIEAARNNKHIFIEKPLALTIDDCNRIKEVVESSGVKLMVGFKFRFAPMVIKTKEFIKEPVIAIGQVMEEKWPDDIWAQDPLQGGGNVLSQGCHTFDLVYFFVESEPIEVFAYGGNFTHPHSPYFDSIVATIKFENGSIGTVIQGDAGCAPFTSKFFFEVFAKDRSATLFERCHKAKLWEENKEVEEFSDKEDPEGYMREMKAFIECIQNDSSSSPGANDGLRAQMLIHKSFESIKTGIPQKINI